MANNPETEKAINERHNSLASCFMPRSKAEAESIELLTDYFEDVRIGTDFSDYDRTDRGLLLNRLADVVSRLKAGW